MDYNPLAMKFKVAFTPRGKKIQSTNPDGAPGLSYTTKYSSVGVVTNDPTFDWHLTNLRNYATSLLK